MLNAIKRLFTRSSGNHDGFTLIELLLVITIIAILAATIIPNFIGFDTEARITATKTNLETLRTRVTLFRAKEGRYPASLQDLVDTYYMDMGVKKPYLNKVPAEMITNKSGNSLYVDAVSTDTTIERTGGWVYYTDTAEIYVNSDEPLDKKWGENEGQKPNEW
ncbi:MAG TPA: prepilin-type N-terminal cleavage/methylation domain-containing protein [Candidatus Omnitrophota bacterium]|nr:prepilin-type N-terminal cleavage/methylation domain-containing protein [Candidatus Omnitrophota bacterium]HPS20622.1 prepilin-type N-terminal cleavage/methylation domain-containing protein [Candidatus Omnitrophota bacterium]